jgi:iron complex outermembrane receptor protein
MQIRILLALCLFAYTAVAQNAKTVYSLKVIVKDSITNNVLEDATVILTKHSDAHLTDMRGVVIFDTLQAGHYHLTCTFIGYHSYEKIIVLSSDQTVTVLLCPAAYHLHETVIEGKSDGNQTAYTLQANARLSMQQIEKMRGQNLGELLGNVNGITTLNTGPGIAKPVLRGLHSNRLVTLNNGVKQEEQQWGAEHAPAIDPFAVAGIEVIKGAASVEYGPEAIGGAIRIIPAPYRKVSGVNGELSLQGFSNNMQGAAALLVEGTHLSKQQLSWRVQGSLRKAGDAKTPDYVISNTGFDEQNGSISLAYTFKRFQVETFMSVFNTTIGIMRAAHIGSSTDLENAIQSDEPLIIKPFTYEIGKPYQQVWHETQSVIFRYQVSTIGKLWLQSSRQLNSRQEYDLGVSWNPQSETHTKPAYDLTLTTFTNDMVFEHKQWKQFTGKMGASWMHQSNYSDGTQKPLIPNFIADTYGIFVFEKWLKGRWAAELGGRYDIRTQTIYERNPQNAIVTRENDYRRSTGIVGAGYAFTEKFSVNTTFSSAWRPPSVNELYSNGLHNGTATYELGDSNLVPEQGYNLDVTVKYTNQKWMIETSIFRNRISGFIYQLPIQPPTVTLRGTFPTFQFTQTDALMQGAEVNFSYSMNKHWLGTASASYLQADDISHNEPLIYMPANRGKLGLQYMAKTVWKMEQFFAEIHWQYVAEQKRYQPGLDYKNPPASYQLVDLQMGFRIPFYKQHINVSASVKNVLNVSYRDYLNRFRYFTDEPGRNFIVRLTIPFEIFTSKN